MKKYLNDEKDRQRLTVEGLSYLRNRDREIDSRNQAGLVIDVRAFAAL